MKHQASDKDYAKKLYNNAVERQKVIFDLRKKGLTMKEIGIIFGVTKGRIWLILRQEIKFENYYREISPLKNEAKWRGNGRERARYLARLRDNFTCQDCNKKWEKGSRHFDVHHLNGLCGKVSRGYDSPKDISGLITLCHKCHFNRPEHLSKKTTP